MNYILNSSADKTLTALLSKYALNTNVKTILDTKGEDGVSNWIKIKRRYSATELQENESKYPTGQVLIKQGTQLVILNAYVNRDALVDLNARLKDTVSKLSGFKPFIASRLLELLQDPRYVNVLKNHSDGQVVSVNEITDVTVYCWSRAMSLPGDTTQQGGWVNLSPFIKQVQTFTDGNLGSFSFALSPVLAEYNNFTGWQIFDNFNVHNNVTTANLLKTDKNGSKRSNFLFEKILQDNDLIYIKFEKLDLERPGVEEASQVVGRVWDMIGFIDKVAYNASPSNATISVQGRDMMKLLIEDGSFFFPEQFAQNIFTDENSILTKRNRFELQAQSLLGAGYTFKSVETVLKFIFNKYSNIGIIPNSVFDVYGLEAIKKKYQLKSSELQRLGESGDIIDQLNSSFLNEERQGAWQICEFVFDPDASQRVLADNSVSRDNGSIINSIRKFCQEPFVEFYGDTYKDKYNFIIRKQPFDAEGYRGLVYGDYVSEEIDQVNVNSINIAKGKKRFNIKKIAGKNIPSVNIPSNVDDSLKSKIRKAIQQRAQSINRPSIISNLVIDIDDSEVLSESLTYHDEAYSWYQIVPRGLGVIDEVARFLLAPIVSFDEYAEVWGNKMNTMEYNYSPSEYLDDAKSKDRNEYLEAQTFYDLQFMVQCGQYLPFARKGTITLTGNRLIKRGMFIYYKATKEIFYVNSVTQFRAIANAAGGNIRTTTLQVTRGLVEPYIKGVWKFFPEGRKLVSYFNIINTEVDNKASINNLGFLKNWKVDKSIFNFFLQRRQFAE